MERYKLDDFEQRCIQDELPYCQEACPLKVNVRAFCGVAEGHFDEARKILSKQCHCRTLLVASAATCQDACVLSQRAAPF